MKQNELNKKIVESLNQPIVINDGNSLLEITDEMLIPLMKQGHENSMQVKAVD